MKLTLLMAGVLLLSANVLQEQKPKKEPRVIYTPTCFVKAGQYAELSESDRLTYTTGLMDGLYAAGLLGAGDENVSGLTSCTEGMDNHQIAAIITKYVKDHPETWHHPVSIDAFNALSAACPHRFKVIY